MPFRMGPWEIALILVIILLVFGIGKLPQIGGVIGKGLHSFRKGASGDDDNEEPVASTVKTSRKKTASEINAD